MHVLIENAGHSEEVTASIQRTRTGLELRQVMLVAGEEGMNFRLTAFQQ